MNMTATIQLKGKDFLTLADYSKEEIEYLLHLALELKEKQQNGERVYAVERQNVGDDF